jgi:hypothetical protein
MNRDKYIFKIAYSDVQDEAKQFIGRKLTQEELHQVKKGIEWGLLTGIDTVLHSAIDVAVKPRAIS